MYFLKNMALTSFEQSINLIEQSKSIAIFISAEPTIDSITSALVCSAWLDKLGKKNEIFYSGDEAIKSLDFFYGLEKFKNEINVAGKFLIKLNVTDVKVKEFSYDIKDNFLRIYITPEAGLFKPTDIITEPSEFNYDLIIVLDSRDLNSIGKIFVNNSEFFYAVPILNIDHLAENELFGGVNLIDISACSVSEILYGLIKNKNNDFFDENITTMLLAGLISKTKSFKSEYVTPNCLRSMADLISLGANKELVIQNLYRKKSLDVLNIWGMILSNLKKQESTKGIYSSFVELLDINNKQVRSSDFIEVINELLVSVPDANVILVSYPIKDGLVRHIVWTDKFHNSIDLIKQFNPRGTKEIAFIDITSNDEIKKLQEDIIKVIDALL